MKKILGWAMVATMSLGAMAACGSDKKSPTTTKAPATSGSTASGSSGSSAVDTFCSQAHDLAVKLKAVIANPSSADAASVTASATKLATDGAALISSNPNDAAKIQACTKELTDAAVPG